MPYTYHELKEKTIQELRDIAKDVHHDAVQGFSQLNKEHLLPALCKALGIDTHVHHRVETGFDKAAIKARMRQLRADRAKALEMREAAVLKGLRTQLHSLNHRLRAHMK